MKGKIIQAQEVVSKVEMEAQPEEEVMAEGGGPLDDAVLLTDSTSREAAGDSPAL